LQSDRGALLDAGRVGRAYGRWAGWGRASGPASRAWACELSVRRRVLPVSSLVRVEEQHRERAKIEFVESLQMRLSGGDVGLAWVGRPNARPYRNPPANRQYLPSLLSPTLPEPSSRSIAALATHCRYRWARFVQRSRHFYADWVPGGHLRFYVHTWPGQSPPPSMHPLRRTPPAEGYRGRGFDEWRPVAASVLQSSPSAPPPWRVGCLSPALSPAPHPRTCSSIGFVCV
jgi:hypothetical protein